MKILYTTAILIVLTKLLSAQSFDVELKNLDNKWINLEDLQGQEFTVIDGYSLNLR
ncbi:MAG: hypothetical protein HQ541_11270 [Mariniphaga sp.]|nr:hypothetical protein [Mariniphaga sp.]